MERHRRTIAKTITWRIVAFFITFVIAYMWTGRIVESTALALILNFTKMIAYYFHERLWNKINFGRK